MFRSFRYFLVKSRTFNNGGCPSDPMMTFVFYNSPMNTEVAPQPQPSGTETWTVGALEVSCCNHYRGCSAVSFSGSSEFLVSSLFRVGSGSVNRALPFWSIHGISLQVSRIDVVPLEIGFDRVFIPQFWSSLVTFAGLKFPVHQASRHPSLLYSNYVSNPSKLGLDNGSLYAGGLSLIEDLQIGDVVLPPDSHEKHIQTFKHINKHMRVYIKHTYNAFTRKY